MAEQEFVRIKAFGKDGTIRFDNRIPRTVLFIDIEHGEVIFNGNVGIVGTIGGIERLELYAE